MKEGIQAATSDNGLFRDAFNASPIGIAVENLEGQPLYSNPYLCSLLGFTEEEMPHRCGDPWEHAYRHPVGWVDWEDRSKS